MVRPVSSLTPGAPPGLADLAVSVGQPQGGFISDATAGPEEDPDSPEPRRAEADLVALRNVNQRLMVENSRLLAATTEPPR